MMSISPDWLLRSQNAASEPYVLGPVGVLARNSQRPYCWLYDMSPELSERWSI